MESEVKLNKINPNLWEIPKTGKMNVPIRVFASEKLLEKMKQDRTLEQAKNIAFLPGIYQYACVMPDGHEGFPVSSLLTRPKTVFPLVVSQPWTTRREGFHPAA